MDKILLVEDELTFREACSGLLIQNGYLVDCATCGAEGLARIAAESYDLIVTGLVLQDMSGMEVLSKAREKDPGIDVIMVTGDANLESAIFALKHGARDYLTKPVNPDEFLHLVSNCLEQRHILDENEELKAMLNLFQASQNIAGCLESERICHLLLEALSRELGLGRGLALLRSDGGLAVKDVKNISSVAAEQITRQILPEMAPESQRELQYVCLPIGIPARARKGARADICQACAIFVHSHKSIFAVMLLFNEPGQALPEIEPRLKNIRFLVEQASRAFDNAAKYLKAKDQLFIDDLSGMFNYRYLEVALERELRRVERYTSSLAVLFLDMDAFKQVNDTHGHPVGSRVLKEMGLLLKKSVRDVDIVIRYGGDEFTIILVETVPEMALLVAERIRKRVESHVFLSAEGYDIRLTCCIGYSCCPDDTMSKDELLEMADQAMYSGKNRGKNCITRFTK